MIEDKLENEFFYKLFGRLSIEEQRVLPANLNKVQPLESKGAKVKTNRR